jgi:flagellar biosynthesis protein FlhG
LVSFECDQAEGLRRMLGGKRPRVFTFLSTLRGRDKALMLNNLCASLASAGSDVLLLDVCNAARSSLAHIGRPNMSLVDVANGNAALDDVLEQTEQGFAVATLYGKSTPRGARGDIDERLERVFNELAARKGAVIIDTECAEDRPFPLQSMCEGDIVIQVTPSPESIKEAYGTIKRLNGQLGRRPFRVLVTGATDEQAAKVFDNMSLAASNYLAVSLELVGSVPADDHLKRAAGLGRPVTDAFPLAVASVAFRRLAQRFALSDTWREASQHY